MFNNPKQDTVVFAFGRFQPPTTGHEILVNQVKNIANLHNAAYVVYVSKTQDGKNNPLSIDVKMQYLKKIFPTIYFIAADSNIRTFVEAAKHLNKTYKNLIMIAGSDRIQSFNKILNDYNGKDFNFENIKVMSAGERDPDSDGPSGMSGTKMREAAINNDIASFMQGMPSTISEDDANDLMQHVKQGLTPMKKFMDNTDIKINEGPELKSTVRAITNDIGEPVLQLYATMKQMAKQFYANKGDLKGFQMVAAGAAKRWYDTFYFNKLGKELRHLTQQSPQYAAPLNTFLSTLPSNFNSLAKELPDILLQIGTRLGDKELARKSQVWMQAREEYSNYLSDLEAQGDEDEYDEPAAKTPKNTLPGQQNAQVDKIVNDILASLPKSISGDIRNAIARSPNKLQALKQEMNRLNMVMQEAIRNKSRSKQIPVSEDVEKTMHNLIKMLESK